jgi:hypothetical protein
MVEANSDELVRVRHELDRLNQARLVGDASAANSERYRRLCAIEVRLLRRAS